MALPLDYPPISDYGLIGDLHSAALVSKAGSIDWLCLPRFDSGAVFSRIIDRERGGYFQVAPLGVRSVSRRYLPGTGILETTFATDSGAARLTDFMPTHPHPAPPNMTQTRVRQVARILECTSGTVKFRVECRPRFDYGTILPHVVLQSDTSGFAHGGADAVSFYSSAPLTATDDGFSASGTLGERQTLTVALTLEPRSPLRGRSFTSHDLGVRDASEVERRLKATRSFWEGWAARCRYDGTWKDEVLRSALTLKMLTYAPSGALVAAPTTSLPETLGGPRNWDYRFTWVRDATFALYALFILGYTEEAKAFKAWLEWSTAGHPAELQAMYGIGGERRLTESELTELEGYRGSRPVRIGNGAYRQRQMDIYGEVLDSAHLYRKFVGELDGEYWEYLVKLVEFVAQHWQDPDEGIWETRGGSQHFVFSKVMCWVAIDRAIKAARALGVPGDVERWEALRQQIKEDVLEHGYDEGRGQFVQAYGSKNLDSAVLMLPLVGFLPGDDPRIRSTVQAIQRELTSAEGFVYRYKDFDDGLNTDEGAFLMCTFWLADNLINLGEIEQARTLFDTLRGCANDLGLYGEQIDPKTGEMRGNFPQAFSHLGLINTALKLSRASERGADPPPVASSASEH